MKKRTQTISIIDFFTLKSAKANQNPTISVFTFVLMAKQKVSRNSNRASSEQQKLQSKSAPVMNKKSAELNRQSSMEDHDSLEKKFQNLKSLNAILLKQTMENRQQIESLSQAKKALEDELTRSGEEKILLREELCGLSDESLLVKIETGLFRGFVESSFKEMGVEIDWLVKEKSDREWEIRDLKREVDGLIRKLRSEREDLSRVCDERDLIKSGFDLKCEEMNQLEGSVVRLEMKEASLGEEVGKLKSTNAKLVKEMSKRAELINRLSKESSEMEKDLEEKTREIDELKSEIKGVMREKMEIEKVIEARGKELVKIKSERERLIKEKKELENCSASLRKEKIILQKDIVEFRKATGVLKTELESARTNAKHNLTMLKNVCSLVSGFENKKGIKKREMGMDPYFVELEAIKEAFKNKESTVDGMKMEIEEMKHSVKYAQKKKSFWTLVSSVTSLFMAASVAYAASIK